MCHIKAVQKTDVRYVRLMILFSIFIIIELLGEKDFSFFFSLSYKSTAAWYNYNTNAINKQ